MDKDDFPEIKTIDKDKWAVDTAYLRLQAEKFEKDAFDQKVKSLVQEEFFSLVEEYRSVPQPKSEPQPKKFKLTIAWSILILGLLSLLTYAVLSLYFRQPIPIDINIF